MAFNEVIAQIDAEISKLRQARVLLAGSPDPVKPGPGRPKGSKNSVPSGQATDVKRKRKLSPEGRRAIADAMKLRWAEKRKQTPK